MGSHGRVLSGSGMMLHFKIISLGAVLRTCYRGVRAEAEQLQGYTNLRVMLYSLLSLITVGSAKITRP